MKGHLKALLVVFTGLSLATCQTQSRTTYLVGRVIDEQNQPVASMPLVIAGHRKDRLSQYDAIQTIYTNKAGEYTLKLDAGQQFSELDVTLNLLKYADSSRHYSGYRVSFNEKRTAQCCPAQIGNTAKYDFILLDVDR
jgi:hypothetical protein